MGQRARRGYRESVRTVVAAGLLASQRLSVHGVYDGFVSQGPQAVRKATLTCICKTFLCFIGVSGHGLLHRPSCGGATAGPGRVSPMLLQRTRFTYFRHHILRTALRQRHQKAKGQTRFAKAPNTSQHTKIVAEKPTGHSDKNHRRTH